MRHFQIKVGLRSVWLVIVCKAAGRGPRSSSPSTLELRAFTVCTAGNYCLFSSSTPTFGTSSRNYWRLTRLVRLRHPTPFLPAYSSHFCKKNHSRKPEPHESNLDCCPLWNAPSCGLVDRSVLIEILWENCRVTGSKLGVPKNCHMWYRCYELPF